MTRNISLSRFSISLAVVAGAATMAGCVSTVPAPRSAMLADAGLTQVAEHPRWKTFRKGDFQPGSYRAVLIEPVVYDAASKGQIDPAAQQILSQELGQRLSEEFGRTFEIVDRPGPGILRLKAAITSVGTPQKVLNAVSMLAVFVPATSGGAAIEAEISDSVSGERLAALAGIESGGKGPKGALTRYTQSKRAFQTLARAFHAVVIGTPANPAA